MKMQLLPLATVLIFFCHNHQLINTTDFKAERFTKSATISINGSPEITFPLFGAFEEKKWSEGWNPKLVYPDSEKIEEGLIFKTKGHIPRQADNTWIVTKYQPEIYLIQYLVITSDNYLVITIKCDQGHTSSTLAKITYSFTGLTTAGNQIGEHLLRKMYAHNLKDWEEAINYYLKNGKTLSH